MHDFQYYSSPERILVARRRSIPHYSLPYPEMARGYNDDSFLLRSPVDAWKSSHDQKYYTGSSRVPSVEQSCD